VIQPNDLEQGWVNSHSVFSGPRKDSGKIFKSEISSNLPQ